MIVAERKVTTVLDKCDHFGEDILTTAYQNEIAVVFLVWAWRGSDSSPEIVSAVIIVGTYKELREDKE